MFEVERVFTSEVAQVIIEKTISTRKRFGSVDPKLLANGLHEAHQSYVAWGDLKKIKTQKETDKFLNGAISNLSKTLALMPELQTFLENANHHESSKLVQATFVGVHGLETDLDVIVCHLKALRDRIQSPNKKRGQDPLKDFVGRLLAKVYETHFGRKAGVSDNGGKVFGPFVDFSISVVGFLKEEIDGEYVKNAINAARKNVKKAVQK